MPVPDGSRPAAIQMSAELGLPYREGLVKNRYVGRTFIMPDQRTRELSVRRKLNAMPAVFSGKSVLLVDDSIVRGTTMSQIVDMVRKAGAKKVCCKFLSPLHACMHAGQWVYLVDDRPNVQLSIHGKSSWLPANILLRPRPYPVRGHRLLGEWVSADACAGSRLHLCRTSSSYNQGNAVVK